MKEFIVSNPGYTAIIIIAICISIVEIVGSIFKKK